MSVICEKPWGKEELLEQNDNYVVKRITITQGRRCSLQMHLRKLETIIVLHGAMLLTLNGEVTQRCEGEYFTIQPGEVHRMQGCSCVEYLEASTPELDDVVRLEDDYSRV